MRRFLNQTVSDVYLFLRLAAGRTPSLFWAEAVLTQICEDTRRSSAYRRSISAGPLTAGSSGLLD